MTSSPRSSVSTLRAFAAHLGYEIVCLLIAVLFCAVEVVVLVSDFSPGRLFRRTFDRKPELALTGIPSRADI